MGALEQQRVQAFSMNINSNKEKWPKLDKIIFLKCMCSKSEYDIKE